MFDAVIILGNRPLKPGTWEFPSHIYNSLDRAAEIYKKNAAKYIVVSGKWTINFDVLNITQPFKECDAMADYLLSKGVPDSAILRESESKDTISNLYYLKQQILLPKSLKTLHFIAAEARLNRIEILSKRILGSDFALSFEGVPYMPGEVSLNESQTLKLQTEFLAPMKDGDESWLDSKFYDDPFYEAVKARAKAGAASEPFLNLAGS